MGKPGRPCPYAAGVSLTGIFKSRALAEWVGGKKEHKYENINKTRWKKDMLSSYILQHAYLSRLALITSALYALLLSLFFCLQIMETV